MKNNFLVFFLLCFFVSFTGNSQDWRPSRIIKINPPSALLINTLNIAYQTANSPNSATQLRVYFTYLDFDGAILSGYGISPEYMHYFGDKAPAGFYVSPYVRYQKYKYQEASCVEYSTTFAGGVVAGYQWVFGRFFSLEMFLGPYYGHVTSEASCSFTIPEQFVQTAGLGIRTGLMIGFSFD
ncbi:MAG: DUF3575 domain-containing protein [Candidatus Cyclobacteriaceae bacterium M2_1C_046]